MALLSHTNAIPGATLSLTTGILVGLALASAVVTTALIASLWPRKEHAHEQD